MIRSFLVGLGHMTMAGDHPAPSSGLWISYLLATHGDRILIIEDEEHPDYGIKIPSIAIEPGMIPSQAAIKLSVELGLRVTGAQLRTVWIDAYDDGDHVRNFVYEVGTFPVEDLKNCRYWNPYEQLGRFDRGSHTALEMIDMQRMASYGQKVIQDVRSLNLMNN